MIRPFRFTAGSHPADRLLPYPIFRTGFREVDEIDPINSTETEKQK